VPLLASLFIGIAGQFATFLATYMAKKTAMGVAASAVLAVIIGSLLVGMRACINALSGILSPASGGLASHFVIGLGMFIPAHAVQFLGCMLATWSACVLYKWQAKGLDWFVKAT